MSKSLRPLALGTLTLLRLDGVFPKLHSRSASPRPRFPGAAYHRRICLPVVRRYRVPLELSSDLRLRLSDNGELVAGGLESAHRL